MAPTPRACVVALLAADLSLPALKEERSLKEGQSSKEERSSLRQEGA